MSSATNRQLDADVRKMQMDLAKLEPRLAKNVTRRGVRAGAGHIRDRARSNVAVRYGILRRHIQARGERSRDRNQMRAVVTIRKGERVVDGRRVNPRLYAHLQEFGTVNMAPRPFLRPAMTDLSGIMNAITSKLVVEVAKEMQKL